MRTEIEGGYMLSQLLREGDVVAVFLGFMIPYILRPCASEGTYKLVGAAFVQGIMRGEILDTTDPLGVGYKAPLNIKIV